MEKELIQSTTYNVKRLLTWIIIFVLLIGFAIYTHMIFSREWLAYDYGSYIKAWIVCLYEMSDIDSGIVYCGIVIALMSVYPAIIISIILFVIRAWLGSMKIVVTDKRVYGTAAFGRRVDLPLDFVSAVGTSWLKGIAVATSSGTIKFILIKNRNEIHHCLSNLLLERQDKAVPATTTIKQEIHQSNADELKKFKELFDAGIITEEEFNAKKKQLLGL